MSLVRVDPVEAARVLRQLDAEAAAERLFNEAWLRWVRGRRGEPCGHDGWVAGCGNCEAQERAALEAMGEL